MIGILLAIVGTVEKLSIEELNSYHSKDEVEEQVDDEDVEDVFQRVDDTVEHGFQLGNPFDGLKRPQHTEDAQRLHSAKIFTSGTSTKEIILSASVYIQYTALKRRPVTLDYLLNSQGDDF